MLCASMVSRGSVSSGCAQWREWKRDRETDEELLRKEYLRLWTEVRHFDPDFVDEEMKQRQANAGIVDVVSGKGKSSAAGGGKGTTSTGSV